LFDKNSKYILTIKTSWSKLVNTRSTVLSLPLQLDFPTVAHATAAKMAAVLNVMVALEAAMAAAVATVVAATMVAAFVGVVM
jgi:hypothetical protein